MKKQLLGLMLLTLGFYSHNATAAPTVIKCPATQVRVEMTTQLPTGWWRTPYVSSLKSTSITKIGGKNTLMCRYGKHGAFSTMRKIPAGMKCRPTKTGFLCQKSQQARTYKTGPLVIPQTYLADLDAGLVREQGADIWFQAATATKRYITPRNGAVMAVAGSRSVNLAGCQRLRLSSRRIPLASVPVGTYVCVKTEQGRYSQFRVNQAVAPSPGVLHIGFTTWAK